METPEPDAGAVETADVLRRMPGLVRAAARFLDVGEVDEDVTAIALPNGFRPDRELVAAAVILIAQYASAVGFDAKDLDEHAVKLDRTAGRQPWRRS